MDKGSQPNNDVHFRRLHLLFVDMVLLVSSILFIIYWGNEGGNRDWRYNVFIVGSGLIIIGCLIVLLFELINKKPGMFNIMGSLFLSVGGILYFIGAIGLAIYFAHHNHIASMTDLNNPDSPTVDIKDAMYWFGLHTLIAMDAIVLAIDCGCYEYFSEIHRLLMWSFPLLWTAWFDFGYWLCYSTSHLTWWETIAKVHFGILAVSILLFMILTSWLHKLVGAALLTIAFFASILFWIYCGVIIKRYVTEGHIACLYIGLPFLISGQILFLHHILGVFRRT